MKMRRGCMDELCHAAEGMSGTAAAASLRALGSIMDKAPSGRLFEAISTLSDMSSRAAATLEDGSLALDRADHAAAAGSIDGALRRMDGLARTAQEMAGPAGKTRRAGR